MGADTLLRALRWIALAVVLLAGLAVEVLILSYLSESHTTLFLAAGAIGTLFAGGLTWKVSKLPSRAASISGLLVILALVLAPPASASAGGRLNYSRFGLNVVGWCPIPALDLVFDADGRLGFRDKTHHIALAEVRPLLENAEQVIIAIGWNGACTVDDDLLKTFQVTILRTGEALELYHRLRREGKRVALLLHSTC